MNECRAYRLLCSTGSVPDRVSSLRSLYRWPLPAHITSSSLVGFWINYGIQQNISVKQVITFRLPIAMQLFPAGALALGTPILRESPTLLWRKGKKNQAIKNLYLRQLPAEHQYMLEEVGRIEARLEEEERLSGGRTGWVALLRGSMAELKTLSMRYRL